MLLRIVLAFAFFVFSLKAAEDGMINFVQLSKKCEEENQLTNEDIQKLNNTKPVITDNQNIKCYFRCLLLELNLMNSEGSIVMDGLDNIKPDFRKYIMECSNATGIEPCDKALNFENCVWARKLIDGGF